MFESEFERNLFALRQEKLQAITGLGQSAYPNHFPASHIIPAVRAQWNDTPAEILNELADLEDSQEGLRATVEKRAPKWKNR